MPAGRLKDTDILLAAYHSQYAFILLCECRQMLRLDCLQAKQGVSLEIWGDEGSEFWLCKWIALYLGCDNDFTLIHDCDNDFTLIRDCDNDFTLIHDCCNVLCFAGHKLHVINLNQQSDSVDLLGGSVGAIALLSIPIVLS